MSHTLNDNGGDDDDDHYDGKNLIDLVTSHANVYLANAPVFDGQIHILGGR